MEISDYGGKLNRHADYLRIIKLLEEKCEYIEYVLIDEDDTRLIERFRDFIISAKPQSEWQGTKTRDSRRVYKIGASKELFAFLRGFETFCRQGEDSVLTDFGINDIAFFDKDEQPLLFTTTHEGYIAVRSDIAKRFLSR